MNKLWNTKGARYRGKEGGEGIKEGGKGGERRYWLI